MAIKTISQFDAATPTSNDKILFEQNGEGKSCSIGEAVNTCSLTLEQIMATTDLTVIGKVPDARSVKALNENKYGSYTLKGSEDVKTMYGVGSEIITEGNDYNAYIIFNISWIALRFKITTNGVYVSYKYGSNDYSTPVKIA